MENKLTLAGEATLADKNIVSHTEVYVNGTLVGNVIGYSINRSRKFGAAKLSLTVANPDGQYTYQKQVSRGEDPLFGYGNKIKLREGLAVNGQIEWFTQFTGIIVSQSPSSAGGKPALSVEALDNMKLLLDAVPEDWRYTPTIVHVTDEVMTSTDPDRLLFSAGNTNWVDIPYPGFKVEGVKQKGNYDVDLTNGQVHFGERMYGRQDFEATQISDRVFKIGRTIRPDFQVKRSFTVSKEYDFFGIEDKDKVNNDTRLPSYTVSGDTITFDSNPFGDLVDIIKENRAIKYLDKKITINTEYEKVVQADYAYYVSGTNAAEDIIKDLALLAGFTPEEINLQATGVSMPPMRFTALTTKNAFEAMQQVKKKLAPNYIIVCDGEGNLRGYYAGQKGVADYDLSLIKRIQAPVSEESLYTCVIANGIDPNPPDLARTATATNLKTSGVIGKGYASATLNKNIQDQISWQWQQKNDKTPPAFPIDLLRIDLAEPKKVEEINILMGDFDGGTIQQSMTVQVSENGTDWFFPDKSAQGLHGSSNQWVTVKGNELNNRLIKAIKIICESGADWTDTHVYTKGGFLGIGAKTKTDVYYNWYFAIKEIQIWEENTISVASSIGNTFGIGNGVKTEFDIPNIPLVIGTEKIYVDGQRVHDYNIDYKGGKVTFTTTPPIGVISADYSMITRKQAVATRYYDQTLGNNVGYINPADTLVFSGGDLDIHAPGYKMLHKIGLKKMPLKIDNYLNSHADLRARAEGMLKETSRLKETLSVDLVYRPDVDICQTVSVTDDLLGLEELYFIEDVTITKQSYRPSLSVKLSNYSAY
jgi:hypothetical protein